MVEALHIDPHNATRRGCYLIEGHAPIATLRAELGDFGAKEIEEKMHIFWEDVMPVLVRECGGPRFHGVNRATGKPYLWQAKRARR
jgi:hypothetical protein